jgi:hypothetical protein
MSEITGTMDKIVCALLEGLISPNKQHYLEQTLRMICEDEWVDAAKKEFKWEVESEM